MSEEHLEENETNIEVPEVMEEPEGFQVTEGSVYESTYKGPKFMCETDLNAVIHILVHADKISPEEAIRRLNNMVAKGSLIIFPMIGTARKA